MNSSSIAANNCEAKGRIELNKAIKTVSKQLNSLQLKAAKENWAIYMLKGMLANAKAFVKPVVSVATYKEIDYALTDAIEAIKEKQVERQERKKK